jgi:mono/diheme cytochrome c family protein
MRFNITFFVALVLMALAPGNAAQAQHRSLRDGVFTAAQSNRGKAQYETHCAACHGAALEGSDTAPELSGSVFLGNWGGLSAAELFTRIRTTMPANEPGSLGDAAVADVMAYLFTVNKFPAGGTELPRDAQALQQIGIAGTSH